MRIVLGTDLQEKEIYLIGSIVSQWGFLEANIFDQTLLSYSFDEDLPSSMKSNAQFSKVLELWLKRVTRLQNTKKEAILFAQYEKIKSLNAFRQAVVHSRWEWNPNEPSQITAIRIHNQSVKSLTFTFDDLADFASSLGEIRFLINYPGGTEDYAQRMKGRGGYISRDAHDLFSGQKSFDETNNGKKQK